MLKKYCYSSIVVVVAVASTMFAQDASQGLAPISADSLNRRDVIGRLGLPLGKVTVIRGTVISGDSTRAKANAGTYLLSVHMVDGKELQKPQLMDFNVAIGSDTQLANDHFQLYQLKKGDKVDKIDSAKLKELEKGYVNSKVLLSVYETGYYSGIPENSNLGIQGSAFSFRTNLEVLSNLDLP